MRLRLVIPATIATAALLMSGVQARAQATLLEGGGLYNVPVTSLSEIPFRTVVRQQYDYSCGSASLATLLKYHYGVDVNEAEIFKAMYAVGDQAKIQKVGFSLLDIKKYLEARGFQSDGFRLTLDQLVHINRPGIAVVTAGAYRHFVVVKGARDGKILVGDPALGLKTYSDAEFAKIWNGIIFAIRATPGEQVAYNNDREWSPWAVAPLGQPLGDESLSQLTRQLPPIYQVSPIIIANPAP